MGIAVYIGRSQEEMNRAWCRQKGNACTRSWVTWCKASFAFGCLTNATLDLYIIILAAFHLIAIVHSLFHYMPCLQVGLLHFNVWSSILYSSSIIIIHTHDLGNQLHHKWHLNRQLWQSGKGVLLGGHMTYITIYRLTNFLSCTQSYSCSVYTHTFNTHPHAYIHTRAHTLKIFDMQWYCIFLTNLTQLDMVQCDTYVHSLAHKIYTSATTEHTWFGGGLQLWWHRYTIVSSSADWCHWMRMMFQACWCW